MSAEEHKIKRLERQVRYLAAALQATRDGGSTFPVEEGLEAVQDGRVPETPPRQSSRVA